MAVVERIQIRYEQAPVSDDVIQEKFSIDAGRRLDKDKLVTIKGSITAKFAFSLQVNVSLETE